MKLLSVAEVLWAVGVWSSRFHLPRPKTIRIRLVNTKHIYKMSQLLFLKAFGI